ncbi:hypothetical protein [Breznakia pachnodae]|uniref:Uncharacterized protein n=1 Tax=Breznakia pachnodae TaxID=265178 RepID=A0ABU0E6I3_9FIRM|nr:hypothetical protein [Breznakia pachnodae]MDQ0362521.1 hypothetical protein [Breznakia pachnodae]
MADWYNLKMSIAEGYIKDNKIKWDEINHDQLFYLAVELNIPDSVLAIMFDVTKNQVTYKRRVKYNIKIV